MRTHYDNLKVARNAPPEIIRAAYKALSQKYHPDKNDSAPFAEKTMAIINESYEVLSDPDKRRAHDAWIAKMERQPINAESIQAQTTIREKEKSQYSNLNRTVRVVKVLIRDSLVYLFKLGMYLGFISLIFWGLTLKDKHSDTQQNRPAPQHSKAPEPAPYKRPSKAPNGKPFPKGAGYVQGYKILHNGGLSSVTVDNTKNDSDVFVKLFALRGANPYPVRQFFIPAFQQFTLENVDIGSYDIRYRDLDTGALSRSEMFQLNETPTYNGTSYSNITMTLYKVRNGNMQTYGLSEKDF